MNETIFDTKEELTAWLIEAIYHREPKLVDRAAKKFSTTRQTVNRELQRLTAKGLLAASGNTRAREYRLCILAQHWVKLTVRDRIEEDAIWRQEMLPLVGEILKPVRDICQYGFTEMLNNALEHSGSIEIEVGFRRTAATIELYVRDYGIGIFNKVQQKCSLEDPRHAIFELSKGKLTTDPGSHSGQGVFFTSRMFDDFNISSSGLALVCRNEQDWLIEVDQKEGPLPGTWVRMKISPFSTRTLKEVFDRFSTSNDDFGFSKTHVPLTLARYGMEELVSRSQARRVLARCDRFREIMLNFKNIGSIGQAFADEIFRVYQKQHPEISIVPIFANSEVQTMIRRVRAELKEQTGQFTNPWN